MKKKLIIFLAAALVLCLTVAGTAAYFTNDVKTHNVITSGNVKVDLVEFGEGDQLFEDVKGAMPGMSIAKVVKAKNVGTGAAWVRMKLDMSITPAEGSDAELDPDLVSLVMESENWVEKDGWYYYEKPLMPGAESYSEPLISAVRLAEGMGNEWQNVTITIDVIMQATQVANNGTSATDAAPESWPKIK